MRVKLGGLLLLPLALAAACARTDYGLPVPRLDNYSPTVHAGCWSIRPARETLVVMNREHRALGGVLLLSADSTGVYDVQTDGRAETTYRAAMVRSGASGGADTLFWVPRRDGFLLYWFSREARPTLYAHDITGQGALLRGNWTRPGSHMSVVLDSGVVATRLDSCR